MITQPGEKVLAALNSLQNGHEWPVVLDWLKRELAEQVNTMSANKDEVQVRWSQGAYQVLSSFINYSERSLELLNKRR